MPPSPSAFPLIGALYFTMPVWITYALLAAFVLVPVALAFVGDEEPDNAIHHESGDGQPGEDQDDPGLLMAA